MLNSCIDYTHLTRETNDDPPSLDPPTGEMASSLSSTHSIKNPQQELYVWMNLHLQM